MATRFGASDGAKDISRCSRIMWSFGRLLPLLDTVPPSRYSSAASRRAANCSAAVPEREDPVGRGNSTWIFGWERLSALLHDGQLSQPSPGRCRQVIALASSRAKRRLPTPSCPEIRTACGSRPKANQALICDLARSCPVTRSNDKERRLRLTQETDFGL